jgi:hypothetical protein
MEFEKPLQVSQEPATDAYSEILLRNAHYISLALIWYYPFVYA